MTAAAILARARGFGLVLSVHGDRLRWRGRQGRVRQAGVDS